MNGVEPLSKKQKEIPPFTLFYKQTSTSTTSTRPTDLIFLMMESDRESCPKKYLTSTRLEKPTVPIFNTYWVFAPLMISSTTSGFSKVDVSPKLEKSLLATFLKIRLIIFPERVLGKPETICT